MTKQELEKVVFDAFLEAAPDFKAAMASYVQPEDDPPDILCSMSIGQRIGFELKEWLNEKQMERARIGNLKYFESEYFLPAKAAAALGTISVYLTKLLIARGVQPISGPKVDGGRQYVFRKTDLGQLDVTDLVSAARMQSSDS